MRGDPVGSESSGISPKKLPGVLMPPWLPVPARPGGWILPASFPAPQRLMGRFPRYCLAPLSAAALMGRRFSAVVSL